QLFGSILSSSTNRVAVNRQMTGERLVGLGSESWADLREGAEVLEKTGASDGARTRGLRRDRATLSPTEVQPLSAWRGDRAGSRRCQAMPPDFPDHRAAYCGVSTFR